MLVPVRRSQKYEFGLQETVRIKTEGKHVLHVVKIFFRFDGQNFFIPKIETVRTKVLTYLGPRA